MFVDFIVLFNSNIRNWMLELINGTFWYKQLFGWCRFLCDCSFIRSTGARTNGMSTWGRKWCAARHNRPPQVSASHSHSYRPSLNWIVEISALPYTRNIRFSSPIKVVKFCLWLGTWALRGHWWIARLIFAMLQLCISSVIHRNWQCFRKTILAKAALKLLL